MASEDGKPFAIDSEERANWLVNRLARIKAEETRIKAHTKLRLQELATDRVKYEKWIPQLVEWCRSQVKLRKRKTITLEQGQVAFRSEKAKLVIVDPNAAIANAIALQTQTEEDLHLFVEAVTLTKDAYLAYAQKTFDETGELIPGIDRTEDSNENEEPFSLRLG